MHRVMLVQTILLVGVQGPVWYASSPQLLEQKAHTASEYGRLQGLLRYWLAEHVEHWLQGVFAVHAWHTRSVVGVGGTD
jgi:hypothetical protein